MANDLMTYLERLELMAFFAGYPLLYAIIQVINDPGKKPTYVVGRLAKLLPFSYALSGTLFIGMVLKDFYPYTYSFTSIAQRIYDPFLMTWGIFSVVFWIPAFNRRPVLSLLHSLIFFFFLARDVYIRLTSSPGKEIIQNDMKIFTTSLLLNLLCLALVGLVYYLLAYRRRLNSSGASTKR